MCPDTFAKTANCVLLEVAKATAMYLTTTDIEANKTVYNLPRYLSDAAYDGGHRCPDVRVVARPVSHDVVNTTPDGRVDEPDTTARVEVGLTAPVGGMLTERTPDVDMAPVINETEDVQRCPTEYAPSPEVATPASATSSGSNDKTTEKRVCCVM